MTHARWRTHTLTFWHYQCAGWGFVAVAQCMRVYFVHGWRGDLELSIALQVAAAFLFTSLLRLWYRTIRYQTFPLAAIVGLIAAGSSAVSVVWWGAFLLLQHSLFGAEALNDALIPLNIITVFAYTFPKHLIWSTLYFGIKVWQDWIEEREHAARAAAEAQRAQFHMLRYKLNPEFFFSTLRRIHQLMETDAASAKAMVTSLAECLRYSLVTKNGGSVPLSIELDAVRQYLSLEQELGGGRLNVVFDLDETIQSKMLPAYSILTPVEYMLRSLALADDDGGAVTMEVRSRCRENELEISLSRLGSGLRSTIEPSFDQRLGEMQARFAESSAGGGRMELVHEHGEQRIAVNVIFSDQDTYGTKITNDHH